jgi:membrane-bound lytic murein transglycosylase A
MNPTKAIPRQAWIGLALLLLAACAEKPSEKPAPLLTLAPVEFSKLSGWDSDDQSQALPALLRSCARLEKQPADRPVGPDGMAGTVADWLGPCQAAKSLPAGDAAAARRFFEGEFQPFVDADRDEPQGLFTGYYEPELEGARAPDATHTVPLYRRPDDLVLVNLGDFRADLKGDSIAGRVIDGTLKPYYSYQEIDEGALKGKDLELVWVADPIDAFFLHIQGSGLIRFADGSSMQVGYAAKNGQPFVAIGKTLLDQGELQKGQVTTQSIKEWLRTHPDRAASIMYMNRSYIFYREIKGDGPIGAQGVALTAGRSLAVDTKLMPLGAPIWLDTTWPADTPEADQKLRRLVVAQDTGGAIKGAVRGDIFFGSGEQALDYAGRMKQPGRYYLLLPRAVALKHVATN